MREKIIVFLMALSLFSMNKTFGQEPDKASRQKSLDAFTKGNYEQAYRGFSQLLVSYPKDPLYKYYSAVSLVKLTRQPSVAQKLLEEALAVPVKTLPADALFYLGRSRQMQGNFAGAEKAFKDYISNAGKKAAKELDVDEYLRECKMGQGKIVEETGKESSSNVAESSAVIADSKKTEPVAKQADRLPQEIDNKMQGTLNQQYKADSLAALARINQPVAQKKQADTVIEVSKPLNLENEKSTSNVQETTVTGEQSAMLKQAGVYSIFEILPKPVTDPKEKIEINPSVPEGLIYRIQLAVFRNPVSLAYFKGITPIYGFRLSGSAVTTYYAGLFRKMEDASKAANVIKAKGFKDAFIVGFLAGKPVSADRAAMLEKEWGIKPLFNVTRTDTGAENDTIPPTLVFRVEVVKSLKPLKEDVTENLRKLSGTRGMDIVTLNDGSTTYLIGNFITFESADQYAALLVRNGYHDAHVVAWLGKREIDVDTARKLFENLK